LALGVPESALAENVRLSSRLRARRKPLCFAIEDAVLEAWLGLTIRPGFNLADDPIDRGAAVLTEGSVLFF
jgi:hypothetical protein